MKEPQKLNIKDEEALNAAGISLDQETELEKSVDEQVTDQLAMEDQYKKDIANLKEQLLRAMADFENYKKRSEREKAETASYAITKFSKDILTVSDNLDRALQSLGEDKSALKEELKAFVEGIEITASDLSNTFEKHSIQKVDPLGEKFDHNLHQAMFDVETDESPEGTVLQVMQPGFILKDRLLRPALVGVAKAKSDTDSNDSN